MKRTVGWAFLACYTLDAAGSIASFFQPKVAIFSSALSMIAIVLCTVIVVLSCLGTLLPRKVFITLPAYYGAMLLFGVVISLMLIPKMPLGELPPLEAGPQYIAKYFPWYPTAALTLVVIQLGFAIYGIVAMAASQPSSDNRDD